MTTIGERIDKLTIEYCEIYDEYEENPRFDNARSIALADPTSKKYIWGQVHKNVKKYIDEQEGTK